MPFDADSDCGAWDQLHARILVAREDRDDFNETELVNELNALTFESMELSSRGRAAVHDLVHVRFGMTREKISPVAVRRPSVVELQAYAVMLAADVE